MTEGLHQLREVSITAVEDPKPLKAHQVLSIQIKRELQAQLSTSLNKSDTAKVNECNQVLLRAGKMGLRALMSSFSTMGKDWLQT